MKTGTADLHMHTTCSDGFSTPERLARHLLTAGLQVVSVTDHDSIEGSIRTRLALEGRGPEVITGEEVSTAQGHVVAIFISERIRPGMSAAATIDSIHEQGGLAIAAHPFSFPWAPDRKFFVGVGQLAWTLPFDAVEVVNGAPLLEFANHRARQRHLGSDRVAVGGSDAHVVHGVGGVHTRFPGNTAADLRVAIETGQVAPGIRRFGQAVAAPMHLSWLIGRQVIRKLVGPGFMQPRFRWQPFDV